MGCLPTGQLNSKKSGWKLQGFAGDPASEVRDSNGYHILLAPQVTKTNPDSKGGGLDSTSQWDEWQRTVRPDLLHHAHFPDGKTEVSETFSTPHRQQLEGSRDPSWNPGLPKVGTKAPPTQPSCASEPRANVNGGLVSLTGCAFRNRSRKTIKNKAVIWIS